MDTATALIWLAAISFFGGAWLTGRFAPAASTVVFPVVWVVLVVVLAVRGELSEFRDYLVAGIGLVIVMVAIGSGTGRRKAVADDRSGA
jgi:hypothetical protein